MIAVPIGWSLVPKVCTGMVFAESAKICVIGASEKYEVVAAAGFRLSYAAGVDGKLACLAKTFACCSGAVSHLARAMASFWCLPAVGTPMNEPPQLAAVGAAATSHLPLPASPDFSWM